MIGDAIRTVVQGHVLTAQAMENAMALILEGQASSAQLAALAVGLRMRGEEAVELAAAARVLRQRARAIPLQVEGPLLDTCGTGGDGAGTFNISTVSAIVVAACGVRVAKHGNRAVSSKSGSADVLEVLGVSLAEESDEVAACIHELGIGFLFAPAFHGALRHAAPVRKELGLRTFFNLLGPLANPASATHQLLGVYDPARLRQIAEVLLELGVEGAWVVHGEGGLDEVSPAGPTRVAVLANGQITERTIEPTDFGFEPVSLAAIEGGDSMTNAAIALAILDGVEGAPRTTVTMNAAAALCAAGVEDDLRTAVARAEEAIDSGRARQLLTAWIRRGANG